MNEFEDLLNSVSQVEPGDVVTAEVLTVDANQANVAISGTGVEGVLTLRELTNDRDADINDLVKPGETLELLVLRQVVGKDTDTVTYLVSKKRLEARKAWDKLVGREEEVVTVILDPKVEVRPIEGQMDDLLGEIRKRTDKDERVLVTTLTKKMAEDLTDYLKEMGVRVRYLHSDIATIERAEIIRDLRVGEFDVLVGINLLREGLDMPEVSLVAILDADKEGFLRSDTSLIQTMGRAARNVGGTVIMYADKITDSMARAMDETQRRREIQDTYNKQHHITPKSVKKDVVNLIELTKVAEDDVAYGSKKGGKGRAMTRESLNKVIKTMTLQMKEASKRLEFEKAAELRDRLGQLRQQLADMSHDDTLPKEMEGEDMPSRRYQRKIKRPDAKKR